VRFALAPLGKPRMTRADAWRKRPRVLAYWQYADELRSQAGDFKPENVLIIEFGVPMPASWSKKKREAKLGAPHDQKPDLDNLVKAFCDILVKEDKEIYLTLARKVWSSEGYIECYSSNQLEEICLTWQGDTPQEVRQEV
jgi:Holliday junction resolvase RusA-like endonuclease